MRMTYQREIILEELRRVKSHPTADELYLMVRHRMPRISRATVYRNLEQLSEAGMVVKLMGTGNQRRFDGNTQKHTHIHCVKCGKIADIAAPEDMDSASLPDIQSSCGYKVLGRQIEYTGICPECNSMKSTS